MSANQSPPDLGLAMRVAAPEDIPAMTALIERSAWGLSIKYYEPEQVEAALKGAWGVDTQLVKDGTYFVCARGETMVGCGGWSYRETLFGADAYADRDPRILDPKTEAAKIRAFFVDPDHARLGAGKAILRHCEDAARREGYSRFELMATLSGVDFYRRHGYRGETRRTFPLPGGVDIDFIPMQKSDAD